MGPDAVQGIPGRPTQFLHLISLTGSFSIYFNQLQLCFELFNLFAKCIPSSHLQNFLKNKEIQWLNIGFILKGKNGPLDIFLNAQKIKAETTSEMEHSSKLHSESEPGRLLLGVPVNSFEYSASEFNLAELECGRAH